MCGIIKVKILVMTLKLDNVAMIKRGAEEIQISTEENLLENFMSEEILKAGMDNYSL